MSQPTRTIRHYVRPADITSLGEEEAIQAALEHVKEMNPGFELVSSTRGAMGNGIRLTITLEAGQEP